MPKIASQPGSGKTYDAFDWVIVPTSMSNFLVWVSRVNWPALRTATSTGIGL